MLDHTVRAVILASLSVIIAGCSPKDVQAEVSAKAKSAVRDAGDNTDALRGKNAPGVTLRAKAPLPAWLPPDIWIPDDLNALSEQTVADTTFMLVGKTTIAEAELIDV
jgi:hypothetical protein